MTEPSHTPHQLLLDFPRREALGRDDFLVAPSNADAVGWIDRWPDWPPSPRLRGFVLCGPPGCGKSHLAAVWCQRTGARAMDGGEIDEGMVADAQAETAILVEHANAFTATEETERVALHLCNRVAEGSGTILLVAERPPGRWQFILRDLASRLRALPTVEIGAPDDALMEAVFVKQMADRQLRLSPDVFAFLLPRIERSLGFVRTLVERLDEEALREGRAVTVPLARRVLAALSEA